MLRGDGLAWSSSSPSSSSTIGRGGSTAKCCAIARRVEASGTRLLCFGHAPGGNLGMCHGCVESGAIRFNAPAAFVLVASVVAGC